VAEQGEFAYYRRFSFSWQGQTLDAYCLVNAQTNYPKPPYSKRINNSRPSI